MDLLKYSIISISLPLIIMGCSNGSMTNNGIVSLHFDVNTAKSYDFLDIFKDINFVALESSKDCFMGPIIQFELLSTEFVFLTSGQHPTIYLFDNKGNFKWKTVYGKGPKEFGVIWGIAINDDEREILVLEYRRIVILNSNGDIKKIIKLEHSIGMPVGEQYFNKNSIICRNMDGVYLRINETGHIDTLHSIKYGWDASSAKIREFDHKPLIMYTFDSFLYTVKNDSLVPKFFLDFGKNNMPPKVNLKYQTHEWVHELFTDFKSSNKAFWFNSFACDNYGRIFFSFLKSEKDYAALWNNENRSSIVLSELFAGVDISLINSPLFNNSRAFFIVDTHNAKEYLKNNKTKVREGYNSITDLINSKDINDNPIIIYGTFK